MLDYAKLLGDAVYQARKSLGLTQKQTAELADIDVRTVLNIENFKGNPKLEVLFPLIRALKIDPLPIFYPEVNRDSSAAQQIQIFFANCSEEEIIALQSICETVLAVMRSGDANEIRTK